MALSLPVQKDLNQYQPKIIGKLTKRTLISIACAIAAALLMGIYINFVIRVSIDDFGWLIILVAVPIWVLGFAKPAQMVAEKWFPLWVKHNFSLNQVRYIPSYKMQTTASERKKKEYGKQAKKRDGYNRKIQRCFTGNGAERMRPSEVFRV